MLPGILDLDRQHSRMKIQNRVDTS